MSLDDWMKKPKGKKPASKKGKDNPPAGEKKEPNEATVETTVEKSQPATPGLHKYELKCPKCKFKKKIRTSGELKAHHKLCKKCGSEMKLLKSE